MKYEILPGALRIPSCDALVHKTAEQFLDEYRQSSKNKYILVRDQKILLDDEPVKDLNETIGRRALTIVLDEEEPDWPCADEACSVIYEDAFVYAVHKEAGIIIHGEPDDTQCLNAKAAAWQKENGILSPVRPLHRLDKDTCGLILYSKIPFFQPWLDAQMEEKKIRRHYLAICYGKGEPGTKFTLNKPLAKDRHRSSAWRTAKEGKSAVTKAEILAKKGKYVMIGCLLETGRTHQIRVHLSDAGYPIVNDPLYGLSSRDFKGMGLWADEIEYRSPLTKKKHRIHDIPMKDYAYFE